MTPSSWRWRMISFASLARRSETSAKKSMCSMTSNMCWVPISLTCVSRMLLRNLARRPEKHWQGVSASIREGLDETLIVTRLDLPPELRRSLAARTSSRTLWACCGASAGT